MDALEALKQIIWKLNRNELDNSGQSVPAKIDRRDAVIRQAVEVIEAAGAPGPTAYQADEILGYGHYAIGRS